MNAPELPFLRRREVVALLEAVATGLVKQFEKMVDAGVIQQVRLTPQGRPYYLRAEIEQKLLAPFRAAAARLAGSADVHTARP